LYVTDVDGVQVLTYPDGNIIGTIQAYGPTCTDPSTGNVYISNGDYIQEFAPAGLTPIASLYFPPSKDEFSMGCAVDPTTGDLAITMVTGHGSKATGFVSIYPNLDSAPTDYTEANFTSFAQFCGYDSQGNLFIDGPISSTRAGLAELVEGGSAFQAITVDANVGVGPVQWDGSYITTEAKTQPPTIYRLSISGSTGTIVGKTVLDRHAKKHIKLRAYIWIQGDTVLSGQGGLHNRNVGFFRYPQGGKVYKKIDPDPKAKKGNTYVNYLLVSTPPSK
jgi:hypothetical protein